MKAQEIMTPSPRCGSFSDSVEDIARLMRDTDCGSIPIVDERSGLIRGIVTDRDLAVRGLATGRGGRTRVGELMTPNPYCCNADDDLRKVEQTMSDRQVRRVPIIDTNGCCVGIVTQADLARSAFDTQRVTDREVAIVVEHISMPRRAPFDRRPQDELEQIF